MKTKALHWLILVMTVLLFTGMTQQAVFADDDMASTIRLVHYEGTVEAEGQDGSLLPLLENMSFQDGEALKTGTDSTASVSLDTERILSLASESRVEFAQKGKGLKLNLTDGELFLDVKSKLGADETLEIQTSTMAVGIRGTIVVASDKRDPVNPAGRQTTLAILEGQTEVFYTDEKGHAQSMMLPAGQKMILRDADGNGQADMAPDTMEMTAADITELAQEQIRKDDTLVKRIRNASDVLERTDDTFAADGDWTWDGTLTLVAQSASKLYDGSPLTRPSDVLVYGLPTGFSIQTAAGGRQTDAGTSSNPVSSYAIFNGRGEDVTAHFEHINTVSGILTVDPAPLTIWTDSASKVYDGTHLTAPETQIRTVPGYEAGDPLWRDTAYVGEAAAGHETLYGVCGLTWVHGTNPLTGEIREIELPAGKKLTVILHDEDGKQSIEFLIEDMKEDEIPEEVLRLYADNPDLLEQACKDAKWDIELVRERIKLLSESNEKETVEQSDLTIARSASEKLMQDSTNVRIHIDTEITNYNGRTLGNEEAHFTGIRIDPSIKITATGSQTDVGKSDNTYTIDWGNANPGNYVLQEDLGELEVTPASLTVTTGSAEKTYDGEPLTSGEAALTGLVNGETAAVTATGSITNAGTAANTYSIEWGTAKKGNYSITEKLGTLTVTAVQEDPIYDDAVTITAASDEKTYDGTALKAATPTVSGLPSGFTATVSVSGSQTDAGSSTNTVTSYKILDSSGKDVTNQFTNVTTKNGTLTVNPAPLTITTGSAEKTFNGKPLTSSETSVDGLVNGETVTVTPTGSQTDAGSSDNTYSISWGTAKSSNYTVTEELGTLTVNKLSVEFNLCGDMVEYYEYTGDPQLPEWIYATYKDSEENIDPSISEEDTEYGCVFLFEIQGGAKVKILINGFTDAGTYTITPEVTFVEGNEKNYDFTYTHTQMVINPAELMVTITGNSDTKTYTGSEQSVTGYEISIPEYATLKEEEISGPAQNEAIASGTDVSEEVYPMGLTAGAFSTTNKNYIVSFSVTDGWLKITQAEETVTPEPEDQAAGALSIEEKSRQIMTDIKDRLVSLIPSDIGKTAEDMEKADTAKTDKDAEDMENKDEPAGEKGENAAQVDDKTDETEIPDDKDPEVTEKDDDTDKDSEKPVQTGEPGSGEKADTGSESEEDGQNQNAGLSGNGASAEPVAEGISAIGTVITEAQTQIGNVVEGAAKLPDNSPLKSEPVTSSEEGQTEGDT